MSSLILELALQKATFIKKKKKPHILLFLICLPSQGGLKEACAAGGDAAVLHQCQNILQVTRTMSCKDLMKSSSEPIS